MSGGAGGGGGGGAEAAGPRTTIRVEIAGEWYTLRTDADEQYTRRCATLVDERMRGVGGETGMAAKKTAIMAALSLADDLMQERARTAGRLRALAEGIEEELLAGVAAGAGTAGAPAASAAAPADAAAPASAAGTGD